MIAKLDEWKPVLILIKRCLEKNGLLYITILCDGDSHVFHALTQEGTSGYIDIKKKDCLNNVHKRMGSSHLGGEGARGVFSVEKGS